MRLEVQADRQTVSDVNQSSSSSVTVTLRVAEARVEDVGHAIARVAPSDLRRMGAHAGDVLKITGEMTCVGQAELSDDGLAFARRRRCSLLQNFKTGTGRGRL